MRVIVAMLIIGLSSIVVAAPSPVKDFTLDNGMRVLVVEQPTAPAVAVELLYHVGSKDEPEARRGLAHLLEHMMQKGSARVPPDAHARDITRLGGESNAFTTDDVTAYEALVPSAALDFVLQLEADRMRGLTLAKEALDTEREVVKEEIRASVDDRPVNLGVARLLELAYTRHPYRVMSVGDEDMIDHVTIDDCRAFYDRFYQPSNATLVLVGAITESDARVLAQKRFGLIARGPAIVRPSIEEPAQTIARHDAIELPIALPVVLGAYHVPAAKHADAYVLEVLQEIVSGGESSRLHRRIVRGGLGVAAGGFLFDYEEPGLFVTYAQLGEGGDAKKVQQAFDDEIALVTQKPVSPAELKKARSQLATRALFAREHAQGLAAAIGIAALEKGDPLAPFHDLQRYDAVTAADVLRVAKAYLGPQGQTSLAITPKAAPPVASKKQTPKTASLRIPHAIESPLLPPNDLPAPRLVLGAVARETLDNGLHVLAVPRGDLPLVHVRLELPAGNLDAPIDRIGLAELTAELLRKGAGRRSAAQLAELVDEAGLALDTTVSDEVTSLSCRARSTALPLCLELVAELAMKPTFDAGELEATRQAILATQVLDVRDNANALALLHSANAYFGDDDPRGRPVSERSLRAITRDEIVAFHAARYRPDGATLVVAGDVDPAKLKAMIGKTLARWPKRGPLEQKARPLPAPRARHVRLVDKPDAAQTSLLLVGPGLAHRDADERAFEYVSYILGADDFPSRLARIDRARSRAYGLFATFDRAREPGTFIVGASTRNEEIARTLRLVLDEVDAMKRSGPKADELALARGHLVGHLALALESAADLADALSGARQDGLADGYVAALPDTLAAVTLAETQKAAATRIAPDTLVVVGPAVVARPLLEALGLVVDEVVAYDAPISAADR